MPRPQLTIRVEGSWSVTDFRKMLGAFETLYHVLALPVIIDEELRRLREEIPPPFWQEFFFRMRPPKRWLLTYPFVPWLPPLTRVLREMPRILGHERGMVISAIRMESPGDIKIDLGLAEVVKELRELLKRNLGYSEEEIRKAITKGDGALNQLLGFTRDQKLLLANTEIAE